MPFRTLVYIGVGQGLAAVIEACLHEDPQRRPSTHGLWTALQEVLTGLGPAER